MGAKALEKSVLAGLRNSMGSGVAGGGLKRERGRQRNMGEDRVRSYRPWLATVALVCIRCSHMGFGERSDVPSKLREGHSCSGQIPVYRAATRRLLH